MKAEELDKQLQAMESDSHVEAAAAGTPPAPPVRRRITTAQVKKELDELRKDIEQDVLTWLGQLDTKLDKIEHEEEPRTVQALAYLQKEIEQLEKSIPIIRDNQNEIMKAYQALQRDVDTIPATPQSPDIADRLSALENEEVPRTTQALAYLHHHVDKLEEATATLTVAVRSLIDEATATPQPAAAEIEFAKPPAAIPDQLAQTADIEAVASVCLTMNDVLMITRALKDSPQLTDLERVEILNIACNSAGVEYTHGLRIRAGVKYLEA